MGLENVVQEIRASGQKNAAAMTREAQDQAAALLTEAQRRADEILARRRNQAESDAAALRRRELAAAQLDAKKMQLSVERDVLARLRAEVESRLSKLSPKDRQAHLKTLVSRARIPQGRILVAEQDVDNAKAAGIQVAGTFAGLGGVIVTTPDGATSEDLRYENILDEVWRETLHDVAAILFAEPATKAA
ncbi:MAG: V-type ATP synthase subunit E family protein [Thermoplasmatota archaeon]